MPLHPKGPLRMKSLVGAVLDLLFPINCLGCEAEGAYLCPECLEALPLLQRPYCALCANPRSATPCRWCRASPLLLDRITAPFLMDGAVRQAVFQLKYHQVRGLASTLGAPMEAAWRATGLSADLVLPVPLHPRRLRQRGYNQSALLAKGVAQGLGLPCDVSALVKTRDTRSQVGLSRDQRASNVQDGFRSSEAVADKAIILVDDVATTGSTLSACAQALRNAGARSVWGLVLAREGGTSPSTAPGNTATQGGENASRPFGRPRGRR